MDINDYNPQECKNKHLTEFERGQIQALLHEGYSANKIAKKLGRVTSTITREIKRGSVEQIKNGKTGLVYYADAALRQYRKNRLSCRPKYKMAKHPQLFVLADQLMKDKKYSPDVVVGVIKQQFPKADFVCTKTLYHYIDLGLLQTSPTDLLLKVKRNTKKATTRRNKRILGTSIEKRPDVINQRKEFGHWEIDTVIGQRSGSGEVLLTLTERLTRYEHLIKIQGKTSHAVMKGLEKLKQEYGGMFNQVFKSITSDNGSEFSELVQVESMGCKVYFTHPYSSGERGTNENHNGIIRRFIPKGTTIEKVSVSYLALIQEWMNALPRKILNYQTPENLFENYLDTIYQLTN